MLKVKTSPNHGNIQTFVPLFQGPHMEKTTCKFTPNFERTVEMFFEAVHMMINSTEKLECIEHQLFQTVEELDVTHISTIKVDEYIIGVAKERIKTVVMNNSHGPNR